MLLEAVREKVNVCTDTVVIFELFWVLSSYYKYSKKEVIAVLRAVIDLHFIALSDRDLIEPAVTLFARENIEFEDCFHIVVANSLRAKDMKSFDKKMVKIWKKERETQELMDDIRKSEAEYRAGKAKRLESLPVFEATPRVDAAYVQTMKEIKAGGVRVLRNAGDIDNYFSQIEKSIKKSKKTSKKQK